MQERDVPEEWQDVCNGRGERKIISPVFGDVYFKRNPKYKNVDVGRKRLNELGMVIWELQNSDYHKTLLNGPQTRALSYAGIAYNRLLTSMLNEVYNIIENRVHSATMLKVVYFVDYGNGEEKLDLNAYRSNKFTKELIGVDGIVDAIRYRPHDIKPPELGEIILKAPASS